MSHPTRRGLAAAALALAAVILSAGPLRAEIQLDLLGRSPFLDAVVRADLEKVRGFIASGQSLNVTDGEGRNAVMLAALVDSPEILALLIDAKARCDVKDKAGNTALLAAAERGFERVAAELIRCKANPNLDNRLGLTPLMLSAQKGHLRVAQLLIQAGANMTQQDRTGHTALEWAEINNRRPVVDFLRRFGAKS